MLDTAKYIPNNLAKLKADIKQQAIKHSKAIPDINSLLLIDCIPIDKLIHRIMRGIIPKGVVYDPTSYDTDIDNNKYLPIDFLFVYDLWFKRNGWAAPKYIHNQWPACKIIMLSEIKELINPQIHSYLRPDLYIPIYLEPENIANRIANAILDTVIYG